MMTALEEDLFMARRVVIDLLPPYMTEAAEGVWDVKDITSLTMWGRAITEIACKNAAVSRNDNYYFSRGEEACCPLCGGRRFHFSRGANPSPLRNRKRKPTSSN
jgi:hypothetical protein